jgi:DNA-binding NtrC family response regulator
VIDDDEQVRNMVRQMLEREQHEVIVAEDGSVGVRRFRQDPVDLVITNILMPEKEGLATIRELKADYPHLPIIAMSGGGTTAGMDFLRMAEHFGAARSLKKPLDWTELVDVVSELLAAANV